MIICALVKHELMHISASVLYSVTQTLGVFHCYITRVRESVWFEYKNYWGPNLPTQFCCGLSVF